MRPGCAKPLRTDGLRVSISWSDHAPIGFPLIGTLHRLWAQILTVHVLGKSRRIGAFADFGLVLLICFVWSVQ